MIDLDQYYTSTSVAATCYESVAQRYDLSTFQLVEPSAGTGSFFSLMPTGSLGYDLDPRYPGVVEQDFLTVDLIAARPIAMIGNPPFGKNASLALKFFNHAARMSTVVAFIVPRTFRKASMINRLDRNFHLMSDTILEPFSFVFENQPYDVPCTFQIWERGDEPRSVIATPTTHADFVFTTADKADFAIQRVGVRAGAIKDDLMVSKQSHYFISAPSEVRLRLEAIDFDAVKHDTAGNPSIAKSELIALYQEILDSSL